MLLIPNVRRYECAVRYGRFTRFQRNAVLKFPVAIIHHHQHVEIGLSVAFASRARAVKDDAQNPAGEPRSQAVKVLGQRRPLLRFKLGQLLKSRGSHIQKPAAFIGSGAGRKLLQQANYTSPLHLMPKPRVVITYPKSACFARDSCDLDGEIVRVIV